MELTKLDRPDLKYEPWAGVTQSRLQPVASGIRDIFSVIADGRRAGPPSVRRVLHLGGAVRLPGVARSRGPGDQTDPVSDIGRGQPHRPRPGARRGVRQADRGARRAHRSVRRGSRTSRWARVLEQAGVHVVYGVVGLKTHAKCSLVVREEGDEIRQYCHIGTGNYHSVTAKLYEDVGLLTADPDITADVADLFNYLTGYSHQQAYRRILVAPITLRSRIHEMIRREADASGRSHRDEDEQPRRRRHDRCAVRGVAVGDRDRPDRPRHLLPASWCARPVRQHPRPIHRRPVPRALADLPLRQREARTRRRSSARPTSCLATWTTGSNASPRSSTAT